MGKHRSEFVRYIRGKFIGMAFQVVDEKVSGQEITLKLDEELDKQIGAKQAEKIQRGPLTNLLFEMLEGLWAEDLDLLVSELDERADKLARKIGDEE